MWLVWGPGGMLVRLQGEHVKEDKADGWVGWVAGHLDCLPQELG